jgi:uncharacterized protein YhjY with autotransporter beta-barrel domain
VGEFRLVDDGSTLDQTKTMMGKGKQSADPGHATSRDNWLASALNLLGSTAFGSNVELAVDG